MIVMIIINGWFDAYNVALLINNLPKKRGCPERWI